MAAVGAASIGCLCRLPRAAQRRQHDIGGPHARRLVAGRHDARRSPQRPRSAAGAAAESVSTSRSGVREFFRRAILLQEFRNHVLADHEIGQDDRGHVDGAPQNPGLDRAGPIGRDHRHPGERQLQRHRAGFGERRARDPKCRPLVLLRRSRSAARPASSSRPRGPPAARCGMVGSTGSNATSCALQPAERLAEYRHDDA